MELLQLVCFNNARVFVPDPGFLYVASVEFWDLHGDVEIGIGIVWFGFGGLEIETRDQSRDPVNVLAMLSRLSLRRERRSRSTFVAFVWCA